MRCVYEAKEYEKNCFITLTYDNEHCPENSSLVKRDLQLFMKKLRKKYGEKIRFYACGEYGEKYDRPHYHACIFNHDFEDKVLWSVREDINLYRSKSLEKMWPYGFSTIGDVTFESAAYVARYVMKKIYGDKAEQHYKGRVPEFTNMSRRPGIGKGFLMKFISDVYPGDKVVIKNGLILRPPKYYDSIYEKIDPAGMEEIKKRRQENHNDYEMQGFRLRCKRRLKEKKLKQLKRGFENEKSICDS